MVYPDDLKLLRRSSVINPIRRNRPAVNGSSIPKRHLSSLKVAGGQETNGLYDSCECMVRGTRIISREIRVHLIDVLSRFRRNDDIHLSKRSCLI